MKQTILNPKGRIIKKASNEKGPPKTEALSLYRGYRKLQTKGTQTEEQSKGKIAR